MVKLTDQIVYIRTKATAENVKKLNLWGCDIDDIDLCALMANIEVLSLSVNKVTSLAPLKNCTKLRELYLRKNDIESLTELEHLKGHKDLQVLWIDQNPCTMANDHRYKVVKMLPQLTNLDDKPVTLDDQRVPFEAEPEHNRDENMHSSTMTLVNNPSFCGRGGAAIVDTVMPSQFLNYGPTSSDTSEEESHIRSEPVLSNSMSQSVHPLMSNSMMSNSGVNPFGNMSQSMTQSMLQLMAQSMYQPSTQNEEREDEWGDFRKYKKRGVHYRRYPRPLMNCGLNEDSYVNGGPTRPLSMDGIAPQLSYYDSGSRTVRAPKSSFSRSASAPRRRFTPRNESDSPAKELRLQKILSAVNVLLDELDVNGLRMVVDEVHIRLKKQR